MGNRDLVREHRAGAIMQSPEHFDFSADGGHGFIIELRREMTAHLPGPDFRIDIEHIGTKMQVDLLKHSFKRALTFLINRKSRINLAHYDWREIEGAIS